MGWPLPVLASILPHACLWPPPTLITPLSLLQTLIHIDSEVISNVLSVHHPLPTFLGETPEVAASHRACCPGHRGGPVSQAVPPEFTCSPSSGAVCGQAPHLPLPSSAPPSHRSEPISSREQTESTYREGRAISYEWGRVQK